MAFKSETKSDVYRNISDDEKSRQRNFDEDEFDTKDLKGWSFKKNSRDPVDDDKLDSGFSRRVSPSSRHPRDNPKPAAVEGIRADLYSNMGGTNSLDNIVTYSKRKSDCGESIGFPRDEESDRRVGGMDGPVRTNGLHQCCCQEDWVDFTEQTSLHGLKYIWLRQGTALRRCLWLVLTLLCSAIMLYQIFDRAIYYYSWPVTVNVKINFNESLQFPTVTICNQNSFRATAAEEAGHYSLVSSLFQDVGSSNVSHLDILNAYNLSYGDLYKESGHQPQDMIIKCRWKGEFCDWRNFSAIYTDSGLCYSFNALAREGADFLTVDAPGSEHGLSLTVNVEQYEYMPGPSDAAGVKVLLHHPHQFPQVGGLGLVLPAGSFAFVGTSMISVSNLPQPHGQCSSPTLRHFQHYSTEACEVDCKTRLLEELCGCRLHYMPGAHVVPECSLQKYYQCYIRNSGKLRRLFATTCKCPVPCEFLIYDTSVSQAATSPLSVDRFLAQTDQSDLKARYDAARDVTHRLQKEKRDRLNHLIENLDLHFGQVRHLVLNQIETKIEQQRAAFAKVVTDVDKVHKQTMYLFEYQRYIVDKDFVRARDAMNERTLSVVCLAFQEFIVQVEAAIQSLSDKNITEPEVRRVLYLDVARKLESRKDMAERAHANYTEFRHALETGTPIFNYKFKSEPRANSPLIAPLPMFYQALNSSSSMRHRAVVLGQNLMNISHRLDTLKDLAERVYREGDLNATELHLQSVNFLFQCRTFSQSRDMFMYDTPEIIARLMKKRDDRLAKLWAQFEAAKTDFHRQADSLMSELQLIQTGALGGIARALTLARMFLQHGNLSKRMVAAEFLREDIVKTQGTLKNFFAEVRSRGHAVYDDWIKIKKAAIAIWFLALTEENLQTYYTAMNMTHMLVDVWDKRVEIATDCGRPRDEHDLRRVVNNVDAQFTDALSDMLKEMTNFRETEGIDGRFMRENILHLSIFYKALSYEQITQQEAYDVFALLCDIGGSMGLFLGASVITVFEVMDLLVFTYLARLLLPRAKDVSTKSTQVDL